MDLVLGDLNLKILAGKTVNLYELNPHLRSDVVRYSEKFGSLHYNVTSKRLEKLSEKPKELLEVAEKYKISTKMGIDRTRSIPNMIPGEKDFFESLDSVFLDNNLILDDTDRAKINKKFADEVDLDGFEHLLDDIDE